jgi:hypothetical protein
MRGRDLIATRDGVFLQHILIEQIHVDEVEQSIFGSWPYIGGLSQNAGVYVRSTKQWPLRTVKYFTKRFEAGMVPTDAAEVILGSRANDPSVADLVVREVGGRSFAGNQGFKVVVDFRVPAPEDLRGVGDDLMLEGGDWPEPIDNHQKRKTPYRSIYCGFVLGEWFYGISYTAAQRHYFKKDVETFESVLQSFQLVEE